MKTNFILYLLLLAFLELPSCESRGEVNKLTITLNGIVKQEVPVTIDVSKYVDHIEKQDPSRKIDPRLPST